MRRPTYQQWKDTVAPLAEKYTLLFLRNPDMWGDDYIVDGKLAFVDYETQDYMFGRGQNHLIDMWVVKVDPQPDMLYFEIDNDKYVGQYKLIDLLYEGTEDYTIGPDEAPMTYWYRYQSRWYGNRKKRHGIRPKLVKLFGKLLNKAALYGARKAVKEWRES